MDISNFKRDSKKIHSALKEIGDTLVATKECRIYVPEHYINSTLGSIEDDIKIVGIFGITVEDKFYATSRTNAMIQIAPSIINVVNINGLKYMEFTFKPGDVIISNLNIVRTGTLVYRIYNELIAGGNIPWYMTYDDLNFLFDTALTHGNANLGVDSAILEMIASAMTRSGKDKTKFFRHGLEEDIDDKPVFIPLRNVALGASNVTAALLGNYFSDAMTSILIKESTNTESIEELLRK